MDLDADFGQIGCTCRIARDRPILNQQRHRHLDRHLVRPIEPARRGAPKAFIDAERRQRRNEARALVEQKVMRDGPNVGLRLALTPISAIVIEHALPAEPLLARLSRHVAERAADQLHSPQVATHFHIAVAVGIDLSPEILERLLIHRQPCALSLDKLAAAVLVPWHEQVNTVFDV